MCVRGLPARLTRRPLPEVKRLATGDGMPGWLSLGDRAGRETAFGTVGKFWQSSIEWKDVPPRPAAEPIDAVAERRGE